MSQSIFHEGDLQSGISLAIQEQKLVACLIRADDDPTSSEWESKWLTDVEEVVREKAVLLRLDYGSKEAGFLSAFCKVEKVPTLVVIHNGRVLEKLERGLDRDDFVERLLKASGLGDDGGVEEQHEVKLGEDTATGDVAQTASAIASAVLPQSVASAAEHSFTPQSPAESQGTPSSLFPDRAARLEADKRERDAAEKAAKQARQDARRKEAEDAHAHHRGDKGKGRATDEPSGDRRARDSYLTQQRQRNDEAKRERARILAQIEADKANRKARSQAAREGSNTAASEPLPESRQASSRRSAGAGGTCALQIRLFDGSSIRSRFPVSSTLNKDVRTWVREQAPEGSGGADIPYTFRQILAPKPSRSIEMSEEHATLQDLDLVPNATLVLVPVAGSVNAYADAGAGGWTRTWPGSLVSSAYNAMPDVGYYLPSFSRLYMGGTGDPEEASNAQGAAMAGADSLPNAANAPGPGAGVVRTRTLFDQRVEAERQDKKTEFYNGNSSAFEGRKDDKEAGGKDE